MRTGKDTKGTRKETFYIKSPWGNMLRNFAHWERLSVTQAINKILEEYLSKKHCDDPEHFTN